jgi:hypothetical protein
MHGRPARVAAGVAAWIASALLAGYLMAPWFAPERDPLARPPEAGDPAPGGSAAEPARRLAPAGPTPLAAPPAPVPPHGGSRADSGAARSPTPPPGAPPEAPAPVPADDAAAGASVGPLPTGTLRVRAADHAGEPLDDGTLYVLPAGARGADDSEAILSADVDEGTATLEVPAGVPLDVGLVGATGATMRTDVVVPAGHTHEVALALTGAAAITATLPDLPPEFHDGALAVQVQLADPGEGIEFPGRHERARAWSTTFNLDRDGRGTSDALAPGTRYALEAIAVPLGPRRGGQPAAATWRFAVTPTQAAPGDHVVVRLAPSAKLRIALDGRGRCRRADPHVQVQVVADGREVARFMAWYEQLMGEPPAPPEPRIPAGADAAQVELLRRAAELQQAQLRLRQRRQWMPLPFEAAVPPGPARLVWGGDGVEPGARELGVLAAGTVTDVTIPVQFAETASQILRLAVPDAGPDEDEELAAVPLALHGVPAPAADRALPPVACFLALAGAPGQEAEVWHGSIDPEEPVLLIAPSDRRRAQLGVAHAGPWLATGPVALGEASAPRLEFRPAGLLVLLPGRLPLPETAAVTVCRTDGAPLPYVETLAGLPLDHLGQVPPHWTADDAATSVCVRVGTVLGPLPAGPVRLEVRRGGFRLGEVTATVVAGQIRAVVLAP